VNSLVRLELFWLCRHVGSKFTFKECAFVQINNWLRFPNYSVQSQQIQVEQATLLLTEIIANRTIDVITQTNSAKQNGKLEYLTLKTKVWCSCSPFSLRPRLCCLTLAGFQLRDSNNLHSILRLRALCYSSNGWRTNSERYPDSNKKHSNLFQKASPVLFCFNNWTIQSQQIQDVYVSKSRIW